MPDLQLQAQTVSQLVVCAAEYKFRFKNKNKKNSFAGITYNRILVDGSRHRIHPRTTGRCCRLDEIVKLLREHGSQVETLCGV